MNDPWDGHAGEHTWAIARTILELLADGQQHDASTIRNHATRTTGANPKTVANVAVALARFGIIDRGNRAYRITTLGADWWNHR